MARGGFLTSLAGEVTTYLLYVIFIVTFGPLQFGFHMAELNAPRAAITCPKNETSSENLESKLPECIRMNTTQFALVSSIYTLGGLLGALLSGPCCNKYGRLLSMRLTTLFFVVGPLFESLSLNIGLMSLGRFLSGVGSGAAIVVVPIYISEIAPPKGKGLFGALTQVMINLGILIAQFLGYFLSRGNLWRIVLATAGGIGVLQIVGLLFVPESPKWLAEHRYPQKARRILEKIRGDRVNVEAEVKAWNIDGNADDIAEEQTLLTAPAGSHPGPNPKASSTTIHIFSALFHPKYRSALIAVIAVMLAQQLTGINSIIMYSVKTLSAILPTTAALLTVTISALNVIISLLCAPLSDRIGRKSCLLISIVGMGANSILLAVSIYNNIKVLLAIATLLFVTSFAIGLGPVPFILANELVGPEAVGATQSWALAANWIATFVVSQFFPMLDQALGYRGKVYYIFAAFAGVFGAFIAWWVPETKGKHGADEVWGRKETRERVE